MKRRNFISLIVISLFSAGTIASATFIGGANLALADGKERAPQRDPARDERLPPVIPGEVVKGADGSEIKVWSSAGPVSGGQVPDAPRLPGGSVAGQTGVGGVIVDTRQLLPNSGAGQELPMLQK